MTMTRVSRMNRGLGTTFVFPSLLLVACCALALTFYYAASDSHDLAVPRFASEDTRSSSSTQHGQVLPPRQEEPGHAGSAGSRSSHLSAAVDRNSVDADGTDAERFVEYFVERAMESLSPAELHRLEDRPWDRLPLALRQAEYEYLNATDQDRGDAERRYDAVFNFAARGSSDGPAMSAAESEAYERYQNALRAAAPHLEAMETEEAAAARESIKNEAFLPLEARANDELEVVR